MPGEARLIAVQIYFASLCRDQITHGRAITAAQNLGHFDESFVTFVEGRLSENDVAAVFDESFSSRTVINKIPLQNKGSITDVRQLCRLAQFLACEVGLTRFGGFDVSAVPLRNLVPVGAGSPC